MILGWATLPSLWRRPGYDVTFGFLEDWAQVFLFVITGPVAACLLIAEEHTISARLRLLLESHVLTLDHDSFSTLANKTIARYRVFNILGGVAGLAAAAAIVCSLLKGVPPSQDRGWQTSDSHVAFSGWVWLLWQCPLVCVVLATYVSRAVATTLLLRDVVVHSPGGPRIEPFHQDNAGGLASIGWLGLRNQYLLALVGLNILIGWIQAKHYQIGDEVVPFFVAYLLCYLIAGPLVFVLPLLPFRAAMITEKRKQQARIGTALSEMYKQIMSRLPDGQFSKQEEEALQRLQRLKKIVGHIPVWPFDVVTRKRFTVAYVIPVLGFAVSIGGRELFVWLTKLLGP